MKLLNAKSKADWELAQVIGNGFTNKKYGVVRAHRGDCFYGPPKWLDQLQKADLAVRLPELPDDLRISDGEADAPEDAGKGPSTTKPDGPTTTKPDDPDTTKDDDAGDDDAGESSDESDPAPEASTENGQADDDLAEKTMDELYSMAQDLKIRGRSKIRSDRDALTAAIREAR